MTEETNDLPAKPRFTVPDSNVAETPRPAPEISPWPDFAPQNPQQWGICICALGLIICFFAPWASYHDSFTGGRLWDYEKNGIRYLLIPLLAAATFFFHRQPKARIWLGIAAALAAWAGVAFFIISAGPAALLGLRWGAPFTLLFALGLFALAGERRVALTANFVARKLNSRKADVSGHWGTHIPDFRLSTKEFYGAVEQAISEKKIPGLEVLRVPYKEGGVLSHQREYLRVVRERQVFDICAAPFGTGYFFSCRESTIPSVVSIPAFLAFMLGGMVVLLQFVIMFGLFAGPLGFLLFAGFGVWLLFNIGRMGLDRLNGVLVKTPLVGPIYEAWFRRDTYFAQDSRILYLQVINDLIRDKVEEFTGGKGIKLLKYFERQPILDALYRPRIQHLEKEPALP